MSLKLSDTRVHEPQIRSRLGTTAHFCEVVVFKLRAVPVESRARSTSSASIRLPGGSQDRSPSASVLDAVTAIGAGPWDALRVVPAEDICEVVGPAHRREAERPAAARTLLLGCVKSPKVDSSSPPRSQRIRFIRVLIVFLAGGSAARDKNHVEVRFLSWGRAPPPLRLAGL